LGDDSLRAVKVDEMMELATMKAVERVHPYKVRSSALCIIIALFR